MSTRLLQLAAALLLAVVSLGASASTRPLRAQLGTTTEIIAGRITGPDSLPIAGATVSVVAVATGVTRTTTSRNDGRYTLLFRDGGTQFRVTITAIGMRPTTFDLARRGDEDRLVADVRLSSNATTLAQVDVRARSARPGSAPASTAGSTEAAVPQAFLQRFPLTPGDLTAVATLLPGVVAVAGGDSTPGGFSVAGQPANQNNAHTRWQFVPLRFSATELRAVGARGDQRVRSPHADSSPAARSRPPRSRAPHARRATPASTDNRRHCNSPPSPRARSTNGITKARSDSGSADHSCAIARTTSRRSTSMRDGTRWPRCSMPHRRSHRTSASRRTRSRGSCSSRAAMGSRTVPEFRARGTHARSPRCSDSTGM